MTTPTVSIGLPVFNGERYLDETIESLVGQTFEDFEIIISDNASTDRTPEICKRWVDHDPRIRYLRGDENRGAAWNYNRVFNEARGTYFKWAAHDDTLLPKWLEECVKALDNQADTVLAYTNVVEIDENSEIIMRWTKYSDVTADEPVERFRPVLHDWRCLPVFGLIRRETLTLTSLIGPYDSSDRVLLSELSMLGKFYRIEEDLFYHREHEARSMRALNSQHSRGAWFDPHNTSALTYWPNWRYHTNLARAIFRAPLSFVETLQALAHLSMRMIRSRRHLMSDVRAAGRAAVDRFKSAEYT